jgi:hypothetical protein
VRVSAALLLGYGAAGLLASIRRGEPGGSRRLAAWTASLGVLLSLGVVSLAHLLPRVREALASGAHETAEMLRRLAFGFGHLAPEAVLLILLGAFAAFGDDRRMPARRWIGGAILGATAWLIVHRMVLV